MCLIFEFSDKHKTSKARDFVDYKIDKKNDWSDLHKFCAPCVLTVEEWNQICT